MTDTAAKPAAKKRAAKKQPALPALEPVEPVTEEATAAEEHNDTTDIKPVPNDPKAYNDGIIAGTISTKMGECDICHTDRRTILLVELITLPIVGASKKGKGGKQMLVSNKLLLFRQNEDGEGTIGISQLGITCGCLAKAHRQLARIDQRVKDKKY